IARQSSKDLLERVFYAARRVTDLGRNLSDQEIRNRLSAFTGVHYRATVCNFILIVYSSALTGETRAYLKVKQSKYTKLQADTFADLSVFGQGVLDLI